MEAESTGHERKGQRTRRRILEAARQCFAEAGFERATIREIADTAGVDKAAVITYFGSKDQLFREAVELRAEFPELPAEDPLATARTILRFALSRWHGEQAHAALARASFTSEAAAQLLREVVTEEGIGPLAKIIDGPDAQLRAGLLASFMFGINAHRELIGIPTLADADVDDIIRVMAPVLAQLLSPS
ncbi:TetR family transcriptional regulator [Streptomyces sp. NPDC096311]|uniref:TetR/AcrR family transcriptional regulator n=1 Tax=Streptomyces sp. NPDC096311 TaxID=3366083 RepID=UPI0037FCDDE6